MIAFGEAASLIQASIREVVAESEQVAAIALDAIAVEYEDLPSITYYVGLLAAFPVTSSGDVLFSLVDDLCRSRC